jgi:hypothetical protein
MAREQHTIAAHRGVNVATLAERIVDKLTSGRFIVTVALTTTISYMLINNITIPGEFMTAYIANIILYYFKSQTIKEE